ncbi:MGDG synthase family glycosyltransferase [Clostridium kluyveri]|uniref:Glycosyltransferase subfamily 4-like N-terminal domain-containing protein n=2 Tax=Clostridium kluyveri TaxID=1534 RepID=A5N077_CLOK5|nr:glycosyltransferase [Clostridium kluyveri]EDK34523.1 Conserved hypothetical protein [Clostridium kluyveri DSM 555]BAH07273.1 hypothetical protein CKR_2222 [Clostridium kluyveri NBRC 12016]
MGIKVFTINVVCSWIIKKKLLQLLKEIKPDIIISVHAVFTGSVTRILEKNHMEIPVISFVADLDNVSNLWADSRAKYILCPTKEAEDKMKSLGISSERLRIVVFPVREEFCSNIPDIDIEAKDSANGSISVLFISGSQGSRQVLKMAKKLLENGKCNVTIIAGKNEVIRKQLKKELAEYSEEHVSIIGFTKEIKKYMTKADILILRASPNVLYEFNQKKIVYLKNNMLRFRNPKAAYNIAAFIIQQCNQQIEEYLNTKEIKSNSVIHDTISQ